MTLYVVIDWIQARIVAVRTSKDAAVVLGKVCVETNEYLPSDDAVDVVAVDVDAETNQRQIWPSHDEEDD